MQIGIFGLLGVIFVTLKLLDVIAWSWWLVLLPLYGGLLFVFTIALIALAIAAWVEVRRGNK